MALKSKLTKAEYDALPDALKEHYKASGDSYLLDSDDATELRAAKDREAEARRTEKERADRLQAEKDAAEKDATEAKLAKAKKDKDVEALELSYKNKEEAAVAIERANTQRRERQLEGILVDSKAMEIANKISISPTLILPHIRARLKAELDGEKAITRVLKDGTVSAMTIEELEREFIDNPEFAAIIKGSKATGGGAGGGALGGGATDQKNFKDLSEVERVELHRTNPAKFHEMAKAAGVSIVR